MSGTPAGRAGGILASVAVPVLVGIVAIGLGVWRLMPGVGYWDTAEFQTVPPILGTAHPTGYPTYVLLGWVASAVLSPIGEAAARMNVFSAICVGVAVAMAVVLVRRLTGSTVIAAVVGLGLAATPVVWGIGTHADPHSLHLAFVAILFWLLVRWEDAVRADEPGADRWLVAAAVTTGLSMGNHSLTLLLGLPILLFVIAVRPDILRRPRLIAACVVAGLVPTVLVYLELPLRAGPFRAPLVYAEPGTWEGFWYVALGEQFRGGISDPFGELPRKAVDLLELAARQLGALAPIVVLGLIATAGRRPAFALLSGSALAITAFFNAAYVNADIERYYLGPVLIAWVWLGILAAAAVEAIATLGGEPARATDGTPRRDPYRLAVTGLLVLVLALPTVAALPSRATLVDRTGDRSAERWLDAVLERLEPDAVVVSWWSYSTSLWYAQHIQGRRLDVFVADDRTRLDQQLGEVSDVIDANLGTRPVYVIRVDQAELQALSARYRLTGIGAAAAPNVFRVLPLESAAAERGRA